MSDAIQVVVGNTTYTIEAREVGIPPHVKLVRSNPLDKHPVEFFVPTSLIVEYVLKQLGARLLYETMKAFR